MWSPLYLKQSEFQAEDPIIIYEVDIASTALRRDCSAWNRPLMERAIVRFAFDHSVRDARHLGRHSSECFAFQIRVDRIGLCVSCVLVAKAVFSHSNRDCRGHPERIAKTPVATLGELRAPPELPRLLRGKVEAAVF